MIHLEFISYNLQLNSCIEFDCTSAANKLLTVYIYSMSK